jgi:hypothetical protein
MEATEDVVELEYMAITLARLAMKVVDASCPANFYKGEVSVENVCDFFGNTELCHPTILAQALKKFKSKLSLDTNPFQWTVNDQLYRSTVKHAEFGSLPELKSEIRVKFFRKYRSQRELYNAFKNVSDEESGAAKKKRKGESTSLIDLVL